MRHLLLTITLLCLHVITTKCRLIEYDDYEDVFSVPERQHHFLIVPVNRHTYSEIVPEVPVYARSSQSLPQCFAQFEKCFQAKEGFKHNDGRIDWDCRSTTGCEEFTTCTEDVIEEKSTDCAPEIGDECVRKLTEYNKKFRPCFMHDLNEAFPGCDINKGNEKTVKVKITKIRNQCKRKSMNFVDNSSLLSKLRLAGIPC